MFEKMRWSESIGNAAKSLGLAAVTITLTLLVATVELSPLAWAQASTYNYGYYTNAHTAGFPSGVLSVINPGSTGGTSPGGDLCTNVYVFNHSQQMEECCSCKVTPDGLRTFNVNTDLTNKPLAPAASLVSGVIKIVSSPVPASGSCNNVAASTYTPSGTLGVWITHVHEAVGTFSVSDSVFSPGVLSTGSVIGTPELNQLQNLCAFVAGTGTSFGICNCGTE
jgi:hypothetical protein